MLSFGSHAFALLVDGKHGKFAVDPEDDFVSKRLLQTGSYSDGELDLARRFVPENGNVLMGHWWSCSAGGRRTDRGGETGIWVIRGEDFLVENIVFRGARGPNLNGSGIRHEEGRLTVRNCLFEDNEMDILTANRQSLSLFVENSEFAHGVLVTPRVSHLLYAGQISRLEVRGSYFHHGKVGLLLKSRARFNLVEYNRLTDEVGGQASYEMDFPDGGVVLLIGNLIRRSVGTDNNRMIAFGAEGLKSADNVLVMASNTLVDDLPAGGEFVRVWSPAQVSVTTYNNLLVGGCVGRACVEEAIKRSAERPQAGRVPWTDALFPAEAGNVHVSDAAWRARLGTNDFRPVPGRKWPVTPVAPGSAFGGYCCKKCGRLLHRRVSFTRTQLLQLHLRLRLQLNAQG